MRNPELVRHHASDERERVGDHQRRLERGELAHDVVREVAREADVPAGHRTRLVVDGTHRSTGEQIDEEPAFMPDVGLEPGLGEDVGVDLLRHQGGDERAEPLHVAVTPMAKNAPPAERSSIPDATWCRLRRENHSSQGCKSVDSGR